MLPHVTNTSVDGVPGFATGDLLAPHPTKKGLWRILGRADDQIMHSNGEKVSVKMTSNVKGAFLLRWLFF